MYRIKFYADKNGRQPVLEYLQMLKAKSDKESRIKANKIRDYIKALSQHGTTLGEPYVKKISGKIWELRPTSDRILFATWTGSGFVLLSHFIKKTTKTPQAEIKKAERRLKDFNERSGNNG